MYTFHYELPLDAALVVAQVIAGDMTVHLPRKNSRHCRIVFYCRSREDARRRMEEFHRYINKASSAASPIELLKENDWAEAWKKQFIVRRVSRRIVVKPAWQEYSGRKGDCIIELEPGMAFGTGEHETTRDCLGLIDEFQSKCPGVSFLDAGCGSGILATAAAKLGFKPVDAIDNDPTAVKTAKNNCVRNNVAEKIICRTADVMCFRPGKKYSVIAANLFANVLIRSAGNLAGLLDRNDDCRLIVSGILEKQYGGVAKAFYKLHLQEVKTIRSQGWVTAAFKR